MNRIFGAIAALLVALLAAGCGGATLQPLESDARLVKARAAGKPLPYRIALARPRMALRPAKPLASHIQWAPDAIQQAAVDALTTAGICRDVRLIPGEDLSTADALQAAWDGGDELLLDLEITGLHASYRGTNGWYWFDMLLWANFIFPAWFIAVEDYDLRIEANARLISVATEETVWSKRVTAEHVDSLDGFERGLVLFGLFRSPSALDAENWSKIGEALRPHAAREWQAVLGSELSAGLRGAAAEPRFADNTRQTLGVVVGCGRYYDTTLDDRKLPSEDAKAVTEWLKRSGAQPRHVRTLVDQDATTESIRKAIREHLAARARAGDRIIFYFAGYAGPDEAGSAALLSHDTDASKPGSTALTLRILADELAAIPDADVLVVIDAGLGGGMRDRWANCGKDAPDPDTIRKDIERLTSRPKTAVIWTCAPGEGAAGAVAARQGVGTFNWIRAAEAARDLDRDGRITMPEVFVAMRQGVQMHAVFSGTVQDPVATGATRADGVAIPRARR